jgi:hypothetical protein
MIFQLFSCKPLVISPLRPFQFHSSPIISYFTLLTTSNIFLLHHTCFAAAQATQKIDQEENNYLDDLLATLQTYQMKFDAHCVSISKLLIIYLLYFIDFGKCLCY